MEVSVEGNPETSVSTDFSSVGLHTVLDIEMENEIQQISGTAPASTWTDSSEHTLIIIFQMIILITLGICGTLTNSLVFWIFNRRPALRSLSNRFVLSLVTANILISSIIGPLILFETIVAHYLLLPCLSQVISTTTNSVIFSATFSTLLIATDRYYAVTSPLHYSMTITRSRSQIMIVVAWCCGILLSVPYMILCVMSNELELQHSFHSCFIIIQLTLGYSLPFIGLCWLYVRMYHAAHRNSERTRKHSISGELLTVIDGTTNIIPQGIDFLTHYMNPFSRTPMAGSIMPVAPILPTATGVIVTAPKKPRRRSSNGSSSSLLFREEGRAIKTAFFVLASFLLCWSPHFAYKLTQELNLVEYTLRPIPYGDWNLFFSVTGMLLSSVLNPFIYVFRNKMACKEVTKLLCGFVRDDDEKKVPTKDHNSQQHQTGPQHEQSNNNAEHHHHHSNIASNHNNNNHHHCPYNENRLNSNSANGSCGGDYGSIIPYNQHSLDYQPSSLLPPIPQQPTPLLLPKSPRRSSMKSLTPQSSLNSTSTHVNLTNGSNESSSSASPTVFHGQNKPPFLRSVTLPEQNINRVKFTPNLIRQKSYIQRTVSGPPNSETIMLTHNFPKKSSRFTRQDSICSILSTDSVLMICEEVGLDGGVDDDREPSSLLLQQQHSNSVDQDRRFSRGQHHHNQQQHSCSRTSSFTNPMNSSSISSHMNAHCVPNGRGGSTYLRQDSNFSDYSHKTNDSGVVPDISMMVKSKHNSSSGGSPDSFTTESPPIQLPQQQQQQPHPANRTEHCSFHHQHSLDKCPPGRCVSGSNYCKKACLKSDVICMHDLPFLQTTI